MGQSSRVFQFTGIALLTLASCSAPGGPGSATDFDWRGDAGAAEPSSSPAAAECRPARASEKLTARLAVISDQAEGATAGTVTKQVFVLDLYNQFRSHCGACHVDLNRGGFQTSLPSFSADLMNREVRERMQSSDPARVMPPGVPFGSRAAPDGVLDLLAGFDAWYKAGRPSGVFSVAGSTQDDPVAATAAYLVSDKLAGELTNLGSCVPNRAMYAKAETSMDELDVFFAQATSLPKNLAATDLVSLDGAVLAERGVIGFVPTYPLWSDGSAKMRAVRIPRGQSIRFDQDKQSFEIPPNTRFYKTFLKKIVDVDGSERYRKIETRLIVARPDGQNEDGSRKINALFGTYAWNDEETEALLVEDPLNNGEPFKDRLLTYVTNEPLVAQVTETLRVSMSGRDLVYLLDSKNPGALRRYAIPGSERCKECHMGSPSGDFVLGFTPLQVNRRPPGHGGVHEDPGPDELTQLQRLIDYGVITGINSPADIHPLEAPQGERVVRNDFELKAQAYMVGNCAHCHNPRGFPTTKEPRLSGQLDLLPSAEGGIFQFPLDRVSPVRKRGAEQDVEMPYITPSLYDYPTKSAGDSDVYTTKCFDDCSDGEAAQWCSPQGAHACIQVPWRSLLYRNVDTPFIYADDYAIFPHMPRNSAGFDCRAPRIFAEWMISIPARRKNRGMDEQLDSSIQPYVEVKPDEEDYVRIKAQAEARLVAYHAGKRYQFCPDQNDIVDQEVLSGTTLTPRDALIFDSKQTEKFSMIRDSVPNKAHWVVSDLTEASGDWAPRRGDWKGFLINPDLEGSESIKKVAMQDPRFKDLLTLLNGVKITEAFRTFAQEKFPLGLWKTDANSTCNFEGYRKVGDPAFADARRPKWMTADLDPERPVYEVLPGEAVFGQICINCHGPQADSKGLLAETILEITGGVTRVANFRDGLLGPRTVPAANRERVFGVAPADPAAPSAEDLAGRYLAFMALGGTDARIPPAALNLIGSTPVLGVKRPNFSSTSKTPNMLQVARDLCKLVLPAASNDVDFDSWFNNGEIKWGSQGGLIAVNGDAELWVRLCSLGNEQIVRAINVSFLASGSEKLELNKEGSFYRATKESYPDSEWVMNQLGERKQGIQPDNIVPICLKPFPCWQRDTKCTTCVGEARDKCDQFDRVLQERGIPDCPAQLSRTNPDGTEMYAFRDVVRVSGKPDFYPDVEKWATRGAINAGLAVYLYLQAIESGQRTPTPPYNQCEKLTTAATAP